MEEKIALARTYQEKTRYIRDNLRHEVNWSEKPATYQRFDVSYNPLPAPETTGGPGIWSCLSNRRSHRQFAEQPLTLQQLSQLLWASQGITHRMTNADFRTAPSAGGLFPVETYLLANRVENLSQGLYHYGVRDHSLGELTQEDLSTPLAEACLGQKLILSSAVTLIWTLATPRTFWKYGNRGLRYMYLDCGHVAQNLYLAAEALGLGCCTIGAFFDNEVDGVVGVDGQEEVSVYLGSVGLKA